MASDMTQEAGAETRVAAPTGVPTGSRRRRKRLGNRPVFRVTQVTHRWLALITGLGLLVIVLTGAVLLYKSPITHALDHDAYYPSGPHRTVSLEGALAAVDTPSANTVVALPTGNWLVSTADGDRAWFVDASTGEVVRETDPRRGFFALLDNIHECALSCEGYPLHWGAMGKPIGGIFGPDLTWSALILGSLGIVLLVLSLGGLVLWWPGRRRLARGLKIRRGNRYKFNYDLHKVAGVVALPFLLMWGLTGANFEFPVISKAWYAVLPGDPPAEVEFASAAPRGGAQPIGDAAAIAAIRAARPGDQLVAFSRPDPSDRTATYSAYVAHGFDPWKHSDYPGDVGVGVDQYTGATKVTFSDDFPHLSAMLEQQWFSSTHMGFVVNPWWRLVFLAFGLVPLLLAVTGITTWLIRRRKARDKRRRQRERAAAKDREAVPA